MTVWIEGLAAGWLVFFFGLGLLLLVFGGDGLCRGAVDLAVIWRVRPVIIGLTVVSIATSSPELMTSLLGSYRGNDNLAFGNIIGSNIGNIGLILAVAALICPLKVRSRLVRTDVPILIATTLVFIFLAWGGIGRFGGAALLGICAAYLVHIVRDSRKSPADFPLDIAGSAHSVFGAVVWVLAGTAALWIGADILVSSSVGIAQRIGVPEAVIGVTLVAIGTSLPELAAAIAAAVRKQADICAGNIVGSCFFNLVLVGGAVSVVAPLDVDPARFSWELPVLVIMTVLLWPFFMTGRTVSRREGAALLGFYGLFLVMVAGTGLL